MNSFERYQCLASTIASANIEFVPYAKKTYFHIIDRMPSTCVEISIRDTHLNQLVGIYRTGSLDRHETYLFIEEKIKEYEDKMHGFEDK